MAQGTHLLWEALLKRGWPRRYPLGRCGSP